jgi:nucleoside-diphosphate-sugar epimerase
VPSNLNPLGALPARFRRQRVLIVGCGDVGRRAARLLDGRVRLMATTSQPARVRELRALGIVPLVADLDDAASLRRLAGIAHRVLHLAPPPAPGKEPGTAWWRDPRTAALTAALRRRGRPAALVYGSTSGVYGDCGGERIDETRAVRPHNARAWRRVDAEGQVRHFGRGGQGATRTAILRIPGIYAPDRDGGTPRERLARGTPVLDRADDVHTNHIHADDLARICVAALWRGGPQRAYHASDDTDLRMGDYFDLAADLYGLPRPPRVPRSEARAQLSVMAMSFMSESRRLDNRRMKRELRVELRYPTVATGLLSDR